MLPALQKHVKVLQVTTLQKVAIKNVILSGNPVSRYMVYQKMTQWSPKTSSLDRAVFTWLLKGICFGFGFSFTTPFGWLVYLLWFWFYDSQVKTALSPS